MKKLSRLLLAVSPIVLWTAAEVKADAVPSPESRVRGYNGLTGKLISGYAADVTQAGKTLIGGVTGVLVITQFCVAAVSAGEAKLVTAGGASIAYIDGAGCVDFSPGFVIAPGNLNCQARTTQTLDGCAVTGLVLEE